MTARTYGIIALRCNPLFQSYSRRLLFLFFLRSLRRQWKTLRRKSWALVRNAIDLDHVAAMRAVIVFTPVVLLSRRKRDHPLSGLRFSLVNLFFNDSIPVLTIKCALFYALTEFWRGTT